MNLRSIPIACLCLLAAPLHASERALKMKDVPTAVQSTIDLQSQGWTVHKVLLETDEGKKSYEAELVNGARHKDLRVDPAGALLEVEEEIQWNELPSEVASAAKEHLGNAHISKIERITEGSASPYYEIAFRDGDEKSEVKFDRSGKLIPTPDAEESEDSEDEGQED